MFYLKITLLISYFLIIFIVFRVASLRRNSFNHFSCSWLSYFIENYLYDQKDTCTTAAEEDTNSKIKRHSQLSNTLKLGENEGTGDFFVKPNQETELLDYQDFIEKVEDTKASVWVVLVDPPTSIKSSDELAKHSDFQKEWSQISSNFTENGIRTGSYQCSKDIRLCLIHKITTPSVLLTMPKGSQPKGKVIVHIFKSSSKLNSPSLYGWVQNKLHPKIKTVHSLSELIERPARRKQNKKAQNPPSMYFVYRTKENAKPPLSISALSVRFTGRIRFYMLKEDKESENDILAMNKFSKYSYGKHNGESFTYSCMELFLKTLHPEVNDIFIASAILLNMACWFEVSLQKGGPLRRLLFCVWGFATSNILLVTIWLPLLKLIYLPQLQPIVEMCLQNLQKFMFTSTAAVLRKDFMELSKHLYIVLTGFVCYGVFLGYLHFKFRNDLSNLSLTDLLQNDINDIRGSFNALIENITPNFQIYQFEARIERILFTLSRSELWLPTESSCEYIKELPKWKFCKLSDYGETVENIEPNLLLESDDESVSVPSCKTEKNCLEDCYNNSPSNCPAYIFKANDCVICLEEYKCGVMLMGLPCGHSFHEKCATDWLFLESSLNKCPVCRWPCNIKKGTKIEIIDAT